MDNTRDVVFMAEVHDETTYVRHHKQKLVLVLSAMRHFAESLHAGGMRMDYVQLDDKDNSGSFTGELGRALSRHHVDRIVVTQPGEWRVWEMMQTWGGSILPRNAGACPIEQMTVTRKMFDRMRCHGRVRIKKFLEDLILLNYGSEPEPYECSEQDLHEQIRKLIMQYNADYPSLVTQNVFAPWKPQLKANGTNYRECRR